MPFEIWRDSAAPRFFQEITRLPDIDDATWAEVQQGGGEFGKILEVYYWDVRLEVIVTIVSKLVYNLTKGLTTYLCRG